MQNTKLVRLLSLFSRHEMEQMLLFSQSPYFNSSRHLVALLEYLIPFAPDFGNPALNSANAYTAIYGKAVKPVDSKVAITKLSSKLLKLCEQFIEHHALKEQPFYGAYFRKKWLQKAKDPVWEEEALRDMEVAHTKYPLKDEFKAYTGYLLEYEWAKSIANGGNAIERLNLNHLSQALDVYYLRAKLECLCHLTNHTLVSGQVYEIGELEAVRNLLELRRSKVEDPYLIWEKALLLLQDPPSEGRYLALKQGQADYGQFLSLAENRAIFSYLAHSARLVFKHSDQYFGALMDLYQMQINSDCLQVGGVLYPITFFNVITVAISLHRLDWANDFYHLYESRLDPAAENSPSIRSLSRSMLLFENRQFAEALEALNQTHFRDIQGKLTERRSRLKIYLELGYEDTFQDQINTFRKFLYVNKPIIPPHHYTSNIAFIQACLMLFKAQRSGQKWVSELLKHMESHPNFPEKSWLEKHIQRLM